MVLAKEVKSLLPEISLCRFCDGKGYIKHSSNPSLIGSISCRECNETGLDEEEFETKDCKCGHCGGLVKVFIKSEIMKYMEKIGSRNLTLDREKLALVIWNNRFKKTTNQDTFINHYGDCCGQCVACDCEWIADAIISNLNNLLLAE